MYQRHHTLLFCWLLLAIFTMSACSGTAKKPVEEEAVITQEADPVQKALKERAETATKELARLKEVKAGITELPLIETFSRETQEREVLTKLGEPENIREVKLEKVEQKVFYYGKSNYAIWFWREKEDQGPYQYRAAMSLKNGKFDMPVHNILTEEELKYVLRFLENSDSKPKK